jgi:hypothetical protein
LLAHAFELAQPGDGVWHRMTAAAVNQRLHQAVDNAIDRTVARLEPAAELTCTTEELRVYRRRSRDAPDRLCTCDGC